MRRARLIAASAAALALAAAPAAAAPAAASFHAALRAAADPRAAGTFVATLSGRTLAWRLTFDGVGRSARSARVQAGTRTVLLCGPCTSGASGRSVLPAAVAAAVRARAASVSVEAGGSLLRGALAGAVVPTLQLPGLADGAVVHLPLQVVPVVGGVDRASSQVLLTLGGRTYRFALVSGAFTLPDDKFLSGRHDLAFVLAGTDGTPLRNPEARVTVYGVYLVGRR